MSKYLLVVRAYNDVDHLTPFIDYLLSNNKGQVYLYSSVPIALLPSDENIRYLKRKYGLEPRYLLGDSSSLLISYTERIYVYLTKLGRDAQLPTALTIILDIFTHCVQKMVTILNKKYRATSVGELWRAIQPDIVCFDWLDPSNFPYDIISQQAKRSRVPLIALPHGLVAYLDPSPEVAKGGKKRNPRLTDLSFDWQVSPNELGKMHIVHGGVPTDKVIVLGSLRYERRWIEKQIEILDRNFSLKEGGLKIVVLMSKLKNRASPHALVRIIEIAKQYGTVVLKPHTRNMRVSYLTDKIEGSGIVVAKSASSSELVNWCDVAVVWGSSVGLQAITRGKPLIYPRFVNTGDTIYDKYLPEIVASNFGEFEAMLQSCKDQKGLNCRGDHIAQMMTDVIYAGNPNSSVAERYVAFFESLLHNESKPVVKSAH